MNVREKRYLYQKSYADKTLSNLQIYTNANRETKRSLLPEQSTTKIFMICLPDMISTSLFCHKSINEKWTDEKLADW